MSKPTMMTEKSPVKVTPERWVEHKNYSDLVGIRGHKNFYVNLLSGKITYKAAGVRPIRTGKTAIMEAKKAVEIELEARRTGKSQEAIKREKSGVIHPTCFAIWKELMELKKVEKAENTMKNYRKSERYGVIPFWGTKTTAEITPANIQDYKVWYLQKYPKRDFYQSFVHLNMLFRYMHKMGYIPKRPDLSELNSINETVQKNSKRVKAGRALKRDEEQKVLKGLEYYRDEARVSWTSSKEYKVFLFKRGRLGVLLGLRCGLRKMEALKLEKEHFVKEERAIKVWSSKNQKWRYIPIPREVFDALVEMEKLTANSPFFFPRPRDPNLHLSSQNFDKVWQHAKRCSGIKGRLRFHDLRHTFATRTAELGMPPVVACEILDMSLKIYQKTYCKPSNEAKAEWMRKLEK